MNTKNPETIKKKKLFSFLAKFISVFFFSSIIMS